MVFAMISESDWKKFKKLKEKALDKLCGLALQDCKEAINDPVRSDHEKYLHLYELVQNHGERIVRVFNEHARSKAHFQLTLMKLEGLIEEADIQAFSAEIQELLRRQG